MELDALQARVDEWIRGIGGYWNEFEIFARLTEEVGELAADLQREKGLRPRKTSTNLKGEVGDVLFTLAAFANKTGISLQEAMEETFAKYDIRDVGAWKQAQKEKIHDALDLIVQQCEGHGGNEWQEEYQRRRSITVPKIPDAKGIMERICIAIAYSQSSRSMEVGKLIRTQKFRDAFFEFDPQSLATASPETILSDYWDDLKVIRFKNKVGKIITCAKVLLGILEEHITFKDYLGQFEIPAHLDRPDAIEKFWNGFDSLQKDLGMRGMPFFNRTTSLLQLLLDLNFDSIKPDLIVMRLCRRLGIVQKETGDPSFRESVRFLQDYSIGRDISAKALDWCLLAFGGQSGAGALLDTKYCPSSSSCKNPSCLVGPKGLCQDFDGRDLGK